MRRKAGEASADACVVRIVRHAKARGREDYVGQDSKRPLSASGQRQAKALAVRFGEARATPVDAVLSSPALRCVETVEPLATARSLEVGTRNWLAEGTSGARALERMMIAAVGLDSLVVCSHGDVIWDLLDHLVDEGVELDAPPAAPKASIWQLEIYEGEVRSGHFQPPP